MSEAPKTGPIALDAMGSDLGPSEMVEAAALALKEFPDIAQLLLVGDEAQLTPLLQEKNLLGSDRVEIIHASQVIEMGEKAIQSLKEKKDSSLVKAIEAVKEGQARCVLSCGNTGSLMAAGTLRVRPEVGIERPSLGIVIPSHNHHAVMVDAGANPDAKPIHLVHNAILGTHYCNCLFDREKPRVGLLTIGTEEGKGNDRIHETHAMLKDLGDLINYRGLIEGFDVFDKDVDVIVCDGFVGNILLKTAESLFYMFKNYLKDEITANPMRTLGALLCKGAFDDMKKQLAPESYGGAQLLGLKGLVMKAHGKSNRYAVKSALGIANRLVKRDMRGHIRDDIARANEIVKPPKEPATAQ